MNGESIVKTNQTLKMCYWENMPLWLFFNTSLNRWDHLAFRKCNNSYKNNNEINISCDRWWPVLWYIECPTIFYHLKGVKETLLLKKKNTGQFCNKCTVCIVVIVDGLSISLPYYGKTDVQIYASNYV